MKENNKLEQIKATFHEHTQSMLYFKDQNDETSIIANVWSFYRTVERILYLNHLPIGNYDNEVRGSVQSTIKGGES